MSLYVVELNRCSCHPETCCCNPYKITMDGEEFITVFNKEIAIHVCDALNKENKVD